MKGNVLELHLTTEKSTTLREERNEYVFRVGREANKLEIQSAVEKAFGVRVQNVRTMVVAGKLKRYGRSVSKTEKWKKAIVKLEKGQVIEDFENI